MGDWDSGLKIINISNQANPVSAGGFNTPGHAGGVFVGGGYAYIADYSSLQILYVTDPVNTSVVSQKYLDIAN